MGTFDRIRERLFDQFQDVAFAPETGLSHEDLQQEVEDYLQAHCDQPRVLQKANVYRIVATGGQIRVTGFSAYFTHLSKDEQDQFIVRNAHPA